MKTIKRYSPVQFKATPAKTETRDNWDVVMEYDSEGDGPWIVDLSHRLRLDLQCADPESKQPFGMDIPKIPCQSILSDGVLINRMNATQASIYHLAGGTAAMPKENEYTDVTENTVFVAIFGNHVFQICEKLSNLDLSDPARQAPFLSQGPFSHVPCQIVTVSKEGTPGVVLTCSRGYGRDMIDAVLHAGKEFGLKPAGEARLTDWLAGLN
ncbi:sarcosine oxidase subunit gamma SoxG [uncultured Desulfobacter sp.]|uniref:sarcosine oxidase subunit gamma SoxG n=1 Tax=uncultured Desulfobacter sp. TaxID=240139 RepID=UPI0029F4F12D|nr:sarcosine oxidase subunit gamma SoxG [uncultured Desulfobacter sp.]